VENPEETDGADSGANSAGSDGAFSAASDGSPVTESDGSASGAADDSPGLAPDESPRSPDGSPGVGSDDDAGVGTDDAISVGSDDAISAAYDNAGGGDLETTAFDRSVVIESLADMAPVPILMLGPLGVICYANAAALRVFGLDLPTVQHKKIEEFAHPVSAEELRMVFAEFERTPGRRTVTIELRERRQYEQPRVIRADIDARGGTSDVAMMCVSLEDLTSQRQRERELLDQASKDPLTGLANRAEVLRLISDGLEDRPEEVVVAYCDLDGFKVVNDTYGHAVGDGLLVTMANCLAGLSRRGDAIGRIGGDEFVFVLLGLDDAAAASFAARVISSIEQRLASGDPLAVTASVGMARGRSGDTARDLLHRADRAMYASKRARRAGGTADGM
jgi:diguanylate cyclase (GGDEF)-like protein